MQSDDWFGFAMLFAASLAGALGIRLLELRAERRNPRRLSLVRPVGETRWVIDVDQLADAARATGIPPRRGPRGFSIHCHGLGRGFDMLRDRRDEDRWLILSNHTPTTVAVLRTLVARFGPLAISIPLDQALVPLEIFPLESERMTIIVDGTLSSEVLAGTLEAAHDELVAEIHKVLDDQA